MRFHLPRHKLWRAFLRYFASEQDFSLESPDTPLPAAIASAQEPFLVIGDRRWLK